MAFEKGKSGNPSGRPSGSTNKASAPARAIIAEALAGTDAAALRQRLEALDDRDFIQAYVKLAEFVTPRLQRTALAAEPDAGRIQVTLDLGNPSSPPF